ncbi:MAG: alpha/beta hydrolase [Litorimonas sp.]
MTLEHPKYETAEIIQPGGRPLPEALKTRLKLYYVNRGDIKLRVMLANAATDTPRGSIIFSPGRTEFIEKYFETIEDLIQRGFNVLMFDPRGQGLSDRLVEDKLKSYVDDFQSYADDFGFINEEFLPLFPKPHIAMGHSMGGTIVLQSVISGTINPDVVVCSAPMLGLFDLDTPLIRLVISALSRLGFAKKNLPFRPQRNGLPVSFSDNKLTSDKERYRIWASYFQTTPRMRLGPPTYGWIRAALASMVYLHRNADKLRVPSLMLAAGADPIVDPTSIQKFAEKSGGDYQVIAGALHELFLEKDEYRNQTFAYIDAFLEAQKL